MKNLTEILDAARVRGACRFVVAQAADTLVLASLEEARKLGMAKPILVGIRKEIVEAAGKIQLNLSGYQIVESRSRQESAIEAVRVMSRREGDVLVKGMLPTAEFLRAVLDKDAGLTRGRILSHIGVFQIPGRDTLLMLSDAALVIAPTLAQKAEILQNAMDLANSLGISSPVAAALAAIETVNPAMPATVDAACLAKMAERGQITGGKVEGPLALDNAISEEAAAHKGIASALAGRADILLAPDIEAANILYKSLIYFAGASDAGIVLGARIPLVVTSRADTAQNRLYSLALGSLAREIAA
jgi:phosphate butyryltransferase